MQSALVFSSLLALAVAQPPKVAIVTPPTDAVRLQIRNQTDRLKDAVAGLKGRGIADDLVVEVEIFARAAEWALRFDEWPHKDSAAWTFAALEEGLRRAEDAKFARGVWRGGSGLTMLRAYRSKIDGSPQPYAVTKPADYGKDLGKAWRLDVVLHGRDNALNEVKFINSHRGKKATSTDSVILEPFGRGNNAYRWAGETDVFEAIDSFMATEKAAGRGRCIDPSRVVLRGFSMGGAGSWHLGLHHPDRWCVIGPGAGFAQTHGYLNGIANSLPSPQEECLTIYDAVACAANAAMVPVVAYAGAKDPQMLAGKTIEAKLKPLNIPMTFLVAPDQEHRMPTEWQQKAEAEYGKRAAAGRPAYPDSVRFVTHTLKYPKCEWVELLRLKRHYDRAEVRATHRAARFDITTTNVERMALRLAYGTKSPVEIAIDGQKLTLLAKKPINSAEVFLERIDNQWQADRDATDTGKVPGLQGPIDDAFTGKFLCVRPTNPPLHRPANDYAVASLDRFGREWRQWMRGPLPEKNDREVTEDDVRDNNLILFGDPASNLWIARLLPRLPLEWDRSKLVLAGKSFDAKKGVPLLIARNPLNPDRYVVLNSGHTFREADFRGTNALLYPRLGDCAVIDPIDEKVHFAGLFDESWRKLRKP